MADASKIVVVKVGTSTLVDANRQVDRAYLDTLAAQLAALREAGWKPIVVTSAAIAAGLNALEIEDRPTDIPSLQAAASVGQVVLSTAYAEALAAHGVLTSVVLLTRHDTASRSAYLHARDAFTRLLELGVVPIVNENDATSVEQIRFGDNDTLAALVACLVKADLCVIFSDVEGLYDGNPAKTANVNLMKKVEKITPDIMAVAGGAGSKVGSGGMVTKLRAARVLMIAGIPMVVCNGREPDALVALCDQPVGEGPGTLFASDTVPHEITGYKLWIALGDSAKGVLVVDDGAKRALERGGSSLLAVGVSDVRGEFAEGDIVDIEDARGNLFARGKANAGSDEALLARGRSQDQLAANRLLAHLAARPLVHRDELVVFE